MTKRFGFTLAEVLITLGIIGVVTAMTIPTLIKNYQKTVWVNQLKKSVSTLEQGFQKMLADDGVDNLNDSSYMRELGKQVDNGGYSNNTSYACEKYEYRDFNNYLSKYFKVLKFVKYDKDSSEPCSLGNEYKTLDGKGDYDGGGDLRQIYLADGSVFGLYGIIPCESWYCGHLAIDVNGEEKGPNQWGRDTFLFNLSSTGHLIPYPDGNCLTKGSSCAGRIIENGWKMDY